MRLYTTTYRPGGNSRFGTRLIAEDVEDAKRIIKARGAGESLDLCYDSHWPSPEAAKQCTFMGLRNILTQPTCHADVTDGTRLLAYLHEANVLGYFALKSGVAKPEDVVGDRGFVHEISHIYNRPYRCEIDIEKVNTTIERALEKAEWFERSVPGWPHGHLADQQELDDVLYRVNVSMNQHNHSRIIERYLRGDSFKSVHQMDTRHATVSAAAAIAGRDRFGYIKEDELALPRSEERVHDT